LEIGIARSCACDFLLGFEGESPSQIRTQQEFVFGVRLRKRFEDAELLDQLFTQMLLQIEVCTDCIACGRMGGAQLKLRCRAVGAAAMSSEQARRRARPDLFEKAR